MVNYEGNLKIKDALQIYFSKYHFENGGYDEKWFRIKLGPFYIPFPNVESRVKAVKIHDIHHVLTGYEANLKGEAEIGAWEIASGCGNYYMAWLLNAGSFLYGSFFFPNAVCRAFMRGRRCRKNLYKDVKYNTQLLEQSIEETKMKTGLDERAGNNLWDWLVFTIWLLLIPGLSLFCITELIFSILRLFLL